MPLAINARYAPLAVFNAMSKSLIACTAGACARLGGCPFNCCSAQMSWVYCYVGESWFYSDSAAARRTIATRQARSLPTTGHAGRSDLLPSAVAGPLVPCATMRSFVSTVLAVKHINPGRWSIRESELGGPPFLRPDDLSSGYIPVKYTQK